MDTGRSRTWWFLPMLAAMLPLLTPGPPAAPQSGRRPFLITTTRICVFADQLPAGLSDDQLAFVACFLAGAQKMPRDEVERLRWLNWSFLVLHYQLAHENGPASFLGGDGNEWVNDFDEVLAHPDWFARYEPGDPGSPRLHNPEWGWFLMDVSSAGYRDYWVDAAIDRMRATGSDGVFADSYGEPFGLGPDPAVPDPDWEWPEWLAGTAPRTTWLPRVNDFGAYVAARLRAEEEQFYYIPNVGPLVTGWDDVLDFGVGDGAMVEGFGAWGAGPLEGEFSDWKLQMNRVLSLVRRGKVVLMQAYLEDPADKARRAFIACCHLLVRGDRSFLNMTTGDVALEYYPEYWVDLGSWVGDPPADIDDLYVPEWGVYRRAFENGFVLVNPTETPRDVTLPGTFHLVTTFGGGAIDEYADGGGWCLSSPVTSVHLPVNGAAFLLAAPQVPPVPWVDDVVRLGPSRVVVEGCFFLPGDAVIEVNGQPVRKTRYAGIEDGMARRLTGRGIDRDVRARIREHVPITVEVYSPAAGARSRAFTVWRR